MFIRARIQEIDKKIDVKTYQKKKNFNIRFIVEV